MLFFPPFYSLLHSFFILFTYSHFSSCPPLLHSWSLKEPARLYSRRSELSLGFILAIWDRRISLLHRVREEGWNLKSHLCKQQCLAANSIPLHASVSQLNCSPRKEETESYFCLHRSVNWKTSGISNIWLTCFFFRLLGKLSQHLNCAGRWYESEREIEILIFIFLHSEKWRFFCFCFVANHWPVKCTLKQVRLTAYATRRSALMTLWPQLCTSSWVSVHTRKL